MAAVDHGFDFPREQLLRGQHQKLTRLGIGDGSGWKESRWQSAGAHQEVDLHLDAVLSAGMVVVAEVPLPQGMIIGAVLQFVSEAGGDLFESFDDVRALTEHFGAINVCDVVQVDVHGEPRYVEVEQVEGGAAFENEFVAKEGMFVELGEQFAEAKKLFEVAGFEAARKLAGSNFMFVCGLQRRVRAFPAP